MKKRAVVVGAGVSGLSIARMLRDRCAVTVLEKAAQTGGLIKCRRIDGNLFHLVGGHVFNSKNAKVLDWFWSHFDRETEFISTKRHAKILLDGELIGYPIENHLYKLPSATVKSVVDDLLSIASRSGEQEATDFEQFLKQKFGNTLYEIYFGPYNAKLWNRDLRTVPLAWLDGKLPMPDIKQILLSNIEKQEETEMVHARFFYPKRDGSQFIINRLAEDTDIRLACEVWSIRFANGLVVVNDGDHESDCLVYCGDVRKLNHIIQTDDPVLRSALQAVTDLPANGTSNVLCETDDMDISWLYLPESKFAAHRIIYTGNFSETNNGNSGRKTCVVEFSGEVSREKIMEELKLLPGNLQPLAFNFEPGSYIIHEHDSAAKIDALKAALRSYNMYLLGRFAEWQYFNMDKCMEAAMALSDVLLNDTTQ